MESSRPLHALQRATGQSTFQICADWMCSFGGLSDKLRAFHQTVNVWHGILHRWNARVEQYWNRFDRPCWSRACLKQHIRNIHG